MSVRIGINPITWTNDDVPELGGDTPLETCLAETREAGYLGTELGGKFPRDSAVLGPILAGYDLQLVGGWWDGRILERSVEAEFDALLPHMTLHRDLGAPRWSMPTPRAAAMAGSGSRSRSGRPSPMTNGADYGRKVTALAEKMDDFGVGLAFHHHMGTVVESDEEVDRLMAVTGPAVGLLYDTGHSAFSGGDPVALVKRHARRIVHVHCKDTRSEALATARHEDRSFMQAVLDGIFTVPGDGSVDYPTILRHLDDAGYAGWLVVEAEQDPRKADPLTYASLGYRNLVALAEAAGFTVETRTVREADMQSGVTSPE